MSYSQNQVMPPRFLTYLDLGRGGNLSLHALPSLSLMFQLHMVHLLPLPPYSNLALSWPNTKEMSCHDYTGYTLDIRYVCTLVIAYCTCDV